MKRFLSAALAAAMAVSLVACGGTTSAPAGSTPAGSTASGSAVSGNAGGSAAAPLKIGGIGPLTGGAAIYGVAVKQGAELAVEEINALGGMQFELNFQDDEHDPEKSVNAYNALKDWGMQVLLGTVTTGPCLAVASEAEADNMFLLTPSASAVDVVKGENAFQVCFTDPNQGVGAADYIADNKLATKVAAILHQI